VVVFYSDFYSFSNNSLISISVLSITASLSWYLRKGRERLLIDKGLEGVAEEIYLKFKELRDEERMLRDELIKEAIKLRANGLTITEIIKLTEIPKSTLYRKLP